MFLALETEHGRVAHRRWIGIVWRAFGMAVFVVMAVNWNTGRKNNSRDWVTATSTWSSDYASQTWIPIDRDRFDKTIEIEPQSFTYSPSEKTRTEKRTSHVENASSVSSSETVSFYSVEYAS